MLGFTAFRGPQPRPEWGLPRPNGCVALTVGGQICWPNQGHGMEVDADLMRSFAPRHLSTTMDWPGLRGIQHFQGVALMDLLRAAGWRGNRLGLLGADGYRMEAPLAELREADPLVARDWNGMPMHCTRHAPLWLVFDYDAAPDRMTRWRLHALSVRALTGVEVL